MECRRVGNRLNMSVGVQVGVCSRNRRELTVVEIRDRLLECRWIEVRIVRAAAIARPPTRVERELHQVGQPQLAAGSRRGAARQCPEGFHVDGCGPVRDQICVQEVLMADLVVGGVVNVLREIAIDPRQAVGVDRIAVPPGTSASWIPPSSLYWV